MNNYEKPVVMITEELAEGIYMASGDSILPLADALQGNFTPQTVGGDESPADNGDALNSNLPDAGVPAGGNGDGDGSDAGADTGDVGSDEQPSTDGDADGSDADGGDLGDGGLDDGETPMFDVPTDSSSLGCQSIYMNGYWMGENMSRMSEEGVSIKDLFGCVGCRAYSSAGCMLIDQYAQTGQGADLSDPAQADMYKPDWERNGHSGDEIWNPTVGF